MYNVNKNSLIYYIYILMSLSTILSKQQENRIFGLDLLRSTAILLVLYGHGFDPFLAENFPNLRSLIFMDGVDLFFVLSGFLIGLILIKQFENKPDYPFLPIFSFWKRRWMRTLPNYYFILFLILFVPVIIPFFKGNSTVIPFEVWSSFLLFSQNLFTPQVNFFSESWSLAVEEWFYLITPIILWLFHKIFKKVLTKKWIFLLVIITVLLGSIIFRYQIGLSLSGKIAEWDSHVRRIVFIRLDSIMYGVLGAFLKFYFPTLWEKKSLFPYMNLMGIICLFVTHYAYLEAIDNNTTIFINTIYFSVSGIGVMFLLPQIDSLKEPPKYGITKIMGKITTHISLISYSLYLTHGYLILGHLIRYKNEYFDKQLPHSPFSGVLYFISYLLISIIISTILYYTVEITFMNKRTKETEIIKIKYKTHISALNNHISQ